MGAVSILVGARSTDSSLVAMPSTGVHQGWLVKSQLLYQLSYAGAPVIVFAESSIACPRGQGRPPALLSNCCQNWSPAWTPSCRIRLATAPTVTIGHRNTKFVFLARWSEGGQKL